MAQTLFPCKRCIYGGILLRFGGIYEFSKVVKSRNGKLYEINYNKNEFGCRMNEFDTKENICINNNFSEFQSLDMLLKKRKL